MAQTPLTATVVGLPHIPSITEVNVRNDPSLKNDFLFKMPVGTRNIPVLDVAPDSRGDSLNGKIYQWLKLRFSDGSVGWIRDNLIEIVGDGTRFGYPVLTTPVLAINLTRREPVTQPPPTTPSEPAPTTGDSNNPFVAKMIGIPNIPSIDSVKPREEAGASKPLFEIPVGTADIPIVAVKQDVNNASLNFKVYQWMKVRVPDGREGYVRDDLIEVKGDGRAFGYGVVDTYTVAYNLTRGKATAPVDKKPIVTPPEDVKPPVETPKENHPISSPMGEATAISMNKSGVNVRGKAGVVPPILTRFQYRDTAKILDSKQGIDGVDAVWVKLDYKGTIGWVREDFLRYRGDFGTIGLSAPDLYPCPVPDAWWSRDFDLNGKRVGAVHHGWDHAGDKGFKIMSGPKGGTVVRKEFCQLCGSQGLSAVQDRGFAVSDSRVLGSSGWNHGYGHFIIMRYDHDILPATTQAELTKRGFSGAHLFVMYAHLQDMLVEAGDTFSTKKQIGTLGNSGNSQGAHLHLEVRASTDKNAEWRRIIGGLMTPGVLFLR